MHRYCGHFAMEIQTEMYFSHIVCFLPSGVLRTMERKGIKICTCHLEKKASFAYSSCSKWSSSHKRWLSKKRCCLLHWKHVHFHELTLASKFSTKVNYPELKRTSELEEQKESDLKDGRRQNIFPTGSLDVYKCSRCHLGWCFLLFLCFVAFLLSLREIVNLTRLVSPQNFG